MAKNNKSDTKEVTKKKVPRKYLNNKDLLIAFHESKEMGKMSDKLAHMLTVLCSRYARKGSFANYTYNDDMQAYAMMMLCKTWGAFNPERSSNPFAFYTQCIKSSFIQYLNQEKKQRDVRDLILVDKGMMPSYTYQLEHENNNNEGSDYHHYREETPENE